MYFECDQAAIDFLARKDKRLGEAMATIGPLRRQVNPDVFASLVNSIVGQQISSPAQATIWRRMNDALPTLDAPSLLALSDNELQAFGISFQKTAYLKGLAQAVAQGQLDLDALATEDDQTIIEALCAIKGIGVWTAEMLLLFSLRRPDVFAFGDLAIHRGLRMLHRHRRIDRAQFEKYRRRYSPHGSVASLYLWAIAGGALEGITDPAPKKKIAKPKAKPTAKAKRNPSRTQARGGHR